MEFYYSMGNWKILIQGESRILLKIVTLIQEAEQRHGGVYFKAEQKQRRAGWLVDGAGRRAAIVTYRLQPQLNW